MIEFDEQKHVYRLGGAIIPGITTVLKHSGHIDTTHYDDWSRERGTHVHTTTELHDLGQLVEKTLDPVLLPYLIAWKKFRTQMGFVPVSIEAPMADPILRVATKIDRIGDINGALSVVEIKTGQAQSWHMIQTALEAVIARANGYYVINRYCVYLSPKATYSLRRHTSPTDERIGRAAVMAYHNRGL